MNVLLQVTPDNYTQSIINELGFMDTLGFGAMMLGIGMLAVFSVLCILWGALVVFKIVFYDIPAKKKGSKVEPKADPAPVAAPVSPAAVSEDEEIIAVIAAAIAAAESECLGAKFRVVSFKRK